MSCGNSVAATVQEAYWRPLQLSLPERGRATSYVDAPGRLPYASPRILNNLGRAGAHPYRTNLGRAGARPYRYANANFRLDPSIRYR
jgi:hypothetical protein